MEVNDSELDYFRISGANAIAATSIISGGTYTVATVGTNFTSVGGPNATSDTTKVGTTFTASAAGTSLTGTGTVNSWFTEIGSGKPFGLIDINGDSIKDTLTVNAISQTALYNHCSNNLQAGQVLRFIYNGVTDATRDMVISNMSYDSTTLYITLVGFDGVTTIQDTVNAIGTQIFWLSHFKSEYASTGGSTHLSLIHI